MAGPFPCVLARRVRLKINVHTRARAHTLTVRRFGRRWDGNRSLAQFLRVWVGLLLLIFFRTVRLRSTYMHVRVRVEN